MAAEKWNGASRIPPTVNLPKRYDEQAVRIHLAESSREHVDVKLIPVDSSNP
jgi:hypothetical protein